MLNRSTRNPGTIRGGVGRRLRSSSPARPCHRARRIRRRCQQRDPGQGHRDGRRDQEKIQNGAIRLKDLNSTTRDSLKGRKGDVGPTGNAGAVGSPGTNGPNGANGIDGDDGADGTNGTNGTDGIDGIVAPLSHTEGLTARPTATPPTVVIDMVVPAGNYVVLAKTQLSHTGAGDTVECLLKAGTTTIDRVAIKTLPALAAVPVSLQAVTTTSPTQLSVECDVLVANGSADFSGLIAIPTGEGGAPGVSGSGACG